MPTYQYLCTECGDSLEVQQTFTEDALTVCPECNGRLRKVFNAVGVVFKGSGFYATDSRAKKTAASTASSSSSDSKSDTKTESKPAAAKSETKTESSKTSGAGSAA